MNDITLVKFAGELVVDSRIVAEQLDIQHKTFLETIRKHLSKLEASFGCVTFQSADIEMPNGGTRKEVAFAYLNEGQVTFLLTLSRNTDRVVDLKIALVKVFQEQKRKLEDPADRALLDGLASRISEIDSDPWSLTNEQAGQVLGMMFGGEGDVAPKQPCKPPTLAVIGESIEIVLGGTKEAARAKAEAIAQAYPELEKTMSIALKYLR